MEETQTTQNNLTDEQGQVSSQAIEPKDDEIISRINTIVRDVRPSFRKSLLCELEQRQESLIDTQDRKEQQTEAEKAETQDQPAGLSIDQRTQERIKSFYKNLDPKTKLAIVTMSELQTLDGINFQARQKEGKLIDEIWEDLQDACLEAYHTDSDDVISVAIGAIDKEDIWMAGVWEACRMVTQNC